MLSAAAWHLPAAAAGLGSLAGGEAPALALAGLAAVAVFLAVLGTAGPDEQAAPAGLDPAAISRPAAALCAAGLAMIALLAGGLAALVWSAQGPAPSLGLVGLALGCAAGALAFGGLARRRR